MGPYAVVLLIGAAGAFAGWRGAAESHRLATALPHHHSLLTLEREPAAYGRPYLNAGVVELDAEMRTVRLAIEFPSAHNMMMKPGYVSLVTAWPPGDPTSSFSLGTRSVAVREDAVPAGAPPTAAHDERVRELLLRATGGPFLYPFDAYTARFSVHFATEDGRSFDSANVPKFAGGLGPGFAGVAVNDSIAGFRTEWRGHLHDKGFAIYSVEVSRPLMPKVLYIGFFALTIAALFAAIVIARDSRDLVAVAAGTIGSTWAVRSIVLGGNAFRTATLVEVTAYAVVLIAALLITTRAIVLSRPTVRHED